MLRYSLHITHETSLLELYGELCRESNKQIVLIIEYPKFFIHPIVLEALLKRFPSIESLATDSPALMRIAKRLGLAHMPLDLGITNTPPPASEILKHNFTIFEYFLYECRRGFWHVARFFSRHKKHLSYKRPLRNSNALLLIASLGISCVLLSFVFYFSVATTTIEIIPEVSAKSLTRNIVLTTNINQSVFRRENEMPLLEIELDKSLELSFDVTSLDAASTRNARGMVEVINELPIAQQLRPGTRFVSEEGVVFKSVGWIKIPGMTLLNGEIIPGKVEAPLIADSIDEKGVIIGSRGNLALDKYLTIPALKFNKNKMYARVSTAFEGGENPTKRVLTKEALEKFEILFREKIKATAADALPLALKTHPGYDDISGWIPIPLYDFWEYRITPIAIVSGGGVGDSMEKITLSGSVHLKAFAYPRKKVGEYLEERFRENILPDTQEIRTVNRESINIENLAFANQSGATMLKATVKITGDIAYNFSNPNNPLLRQTRNLLVGRPKEEALSILKNDPQIADARIHISPFFMKNVSSRLDAIYFDILNK